MTGVQTCALPIYNNEKPQPRDEIVTQETKPGADQWHEVDTMWMQDDDFNTFIAPHRSSSYGDPYLSLLDLHVVAKQKGLPQFCSKEFAMQSIRYDDRPALAITQLTELLNEYSDDRPWAWIVRAKDKNKTFIERILQSNCKEFPAYMVFANLSELVRLFEYVPELSWMFSEKYGSTNSCFLADILTEA